MVPGKQVSEQPDFQKRLTKEAIKKSFDYNLACTLAKDEYSATKHDNFTALAITVRDRLVERWIKTQQRYHKQNLKRVYYFSMEFLIGRLLGNYVMNLEMWEQTRKALTEMGYDLEELRDQEVDAGLGNGGLGRLAACFLDSMATKGVPAHGYGIRYDYGIFKQKLVNGFQVELPDEWLKLGNPWEFARPEYAVKVGFAGHTYLFNDARGKLRVKWVDTEDIMAMPYDIPIPGYANNVVNTLRLWSARSTEEFDLDYFNHGDYEHAVYRKMFSENISKVLYPNDNMSQGRELRLKQEYFFTAASISDIIRRFKVENADIRKLPEKIAIQLNDTHPCLGIVELLRILIDQENLDWEAAWEIVVNVFAYTNHTVMPEALERWPVPLFERLLPRHLQLIYEINARFLREVANRYPGDVDRLRRMSLIEEGEPKRVRMAQLAVVGSHSVNGVSELHSQLVRTQLFRDFSEHYPERFNNKTNGITQRRWLLKANPRLSGLITETIGDAWVTDLYQLKKLLPLRKDASFVKKWQRIKLENKKALTSLIRSQTGVSVDPDSLFDVQVKRIHEYKRQLLFAFYIISQYLKIKQNLDALVCPRTFLVAGKAAPGYVMAKRIIKCINAVADVINNDRSLKGRLRVVFLENYRVSLAERIFPASDLSEQISTAGTEASGTGCMKFMLNGALTIGTMDGANIEMLDEVGKDNMFVFGLSADEIDQAKRAGYDPKEHVRNSPMLKEIFHLLKNDFFSPYDPGLFQPIVDALLSNDTFCVCADFESYVKVQQEVSEAFGEVQSWTKKAITNVASSGKFSSDRTISEYARDIWGVRC